jgi:hypothetical protein
LKAGEVYAGKIEGSVTVNGKHVKGVDMKKVSGFVFQDDVILGMRW